MMASLTAGIKTMRDAAIQITEDDLHNLLEDKTLKKLRVNPLKRTFQCLGDVLLQRSTEATKRASQRAKRANAMKRARAAKIVTATTETKGTTEIEDPATANVLSAFHSPLYGTQPGLSATLEPSTVPNPVTPTRKRKVSQTSYGKTFTDSTPSRLTSPETHIQEVQNSLVRDVIDALYDRPAVPVSWARNRESMTLRYATFIHRCICG